MTPRQINWIPPIKHTILTMLAHPATVYPKIALTTAQTTPTRLKTDVRVPNPVMIRIGFTLRLVNPSNARARIFFNG